MRIPRGLPLFCLQCLASRHCKRRFSSTCSRAKFRYKRTTLTETHQTHLKRIWSFCAQIAILLPQTLVIGQFLVAELLESRWHSLEVKRLPRKQKSRVQFAVSAPCRCGVTVATQSSDGCARKSVRVRFSPSAPIYGVRSLVSQSIPL